MAGIFDAVLGELQKQLGGATSWLQPQQAKQPVFQDVSLMNSPNWLNSFNSSQGGFGSIFKKVEPQALPAASPSGSFQRANPQADPNQIGGGGTWMQQQAQAQRMPNPMAPGSNPGQAQPMPNYGGGGELQNLAQHADLINEYAQSTGVPAGVWAATILGESGGDPTKVNPRSGAVGLMQALPVGGRGGMHSNQELMNPRLQFELAAPEFKAAYARAVGEGLQGQDLWGATIAYAQRYENAIGANGRYDPNTAENRYFRGKVDQAWGAGMDQQIGNRQFLPQQPPPGARNGINQFELGVPFEQAKAICGPVAAMWFAQQTGRSPTLQEAQNLATQVGWTQADGMAGPQSEVDLLGRMGVQARLAQGAPNWQQVAQEVQAGRPVIMSSPGHYYQVTGYDPQSGKFDFGGSALALRAAGGVSQFRPEDIARIFGSQYVPDATIFAQ